MWREAQPITTAGIYRNETDGLISLSSDGSTRYTIADKNLGATVVYNNGDTLSEANCGKYYQRGNNYGFQRTGAISSTSSSKVNAGTYGPNKYYNNSRFRTVQPRDSSNNANLRGGTTGTLVAMKGPCDVGFHIPTNTEWTNINTIFSNFSSGATNFSNYLKLPFAGTRDYYNGSSTLNQGGNGTYWTSKISSNNEAYYLFFRGYTGAINTGGSYEKSLGLSIRPFKNEAVQPDSSRIVIYQ